MNLVRLSGLAAILSAAIGQWTFADDIVRRGAALGDSPSVDLKSAIAAPEAHLGRSLIVEGKVDKVCQMKGCWLELMPPGESRGVRVTFENYGFFVPKDSMGWTARLEGEFVREELSKREVDHLVGEGATLNRQPDGTAVQVSFVARGVELREPRVSGES
ncbi:MAG: DUF4920 domain-containing protein [Gammaproteobacteria bacterium]|nr:DUF4920 domain-containing protein [Gammaproteobacteria bacterium]